MFGKTQVQFRQQRPRACQALGGTGWWRGAREKESDSALSREP